MIVTTCSISNNFPPRPVSADNPPTATGNGFPQTVEGRAANSRRVANPETTIRLVLSSEYAVNQAVTMILTTLGATRTLVSEAVSLAAIANVIGG